MSFKNASRCSSLLALGLAGFGVPALAVDRPVGPSHPVRTLADGQKKEDKGETVPVDKLPKAVVDGVKKAMPGAKFEKPARRTKAGEKVTYFIPDIRVGKKEWDVTVAEDGTIIKKEERHDDD